MAIRANWLFIGVIGKRKDHYEAKTVASCKGNTIIGGPDAEFDLRKVAIPHWRAGATTSEGTAARYFSPNDIVPATRHARL